MNRYGEKISWVERLDRELANAAQDNVEVKYDFDRNTLVYSVRVDDIAAGERNAIYCLEMCIYNQKDWEQLKKYVIYFTEKLSSEDHLRMYIVLKACLWYILNQQSRQPPGYRGLYNTVSNALKDISQWRQLFQLIRAKHFEIHVARNPRGLWESLFGSTTVDISEGTEGLRNTRDDFVEVRRDGSSHEDDFQVNTEDDFI